MNTKLTSYLNTNVKNVLHKTVSFHVPFEKKCTLPKCCDMFIHADTSFKKIT